MKLGRLPIQTSCLMKLTSRWSVQGPSPGLANPPTEGPVFPVRFTDFAVVITSEKVENGAFESDPSRWKKVGNSAGLPIR